MPSYPADLPLIDASCMDEMAAIKRFASLSGASVALKLGERGILILHEGEMQQVPPARVERIRSEEHTSELQSLMRTSYAVFCLKKKKKTNKHLRHTR